MLNKKFIRFAVLCAAIITLVGVVLYIATHGRLVIANADSKQVRVVLVQDSLPGEESVVSNNTLLGTGTYIVRNDSAGAPRLATVSVKGWLQKSTVTFETPPPVNLRRIVVNSYENLLPARSGFVSYTNLDDLVSGYTLHPDTDVFGGEYTDIKLDAPIDSPTPLGSSLLGASGGALVLQKLDGSTKPSILPGVAPLNTNQTSGESPLLRASSDITSNKFIAYWPDTKSVVVADETGKVYTKKTIDIAERVSSVDVSADTFILSTTKLPSSSTSSEDSLYELGLVVGDTRTGRIRQLSLGDGKSLSDVAVSPDGTTVGVVKDGKLFVYNTKDGELVFTDPYSFSNKLLWSKKTMYVLSTDTGLRSYSQNKQQLTPVYSPAKALLSFTNLHVVNGKVYMTAYGKSESKLPDGFVLELNSPKNEPTQKLLEALPYTSDLFDIGFLNSTIYIRVNKFATGGSELPVSEVKVLKKKALEKLESLIDKETIAACQLVYTN